MRLNDLSIRNEQESLQRQSVVGVEVNGKHHNAEKTGCVLVYSDERTEKY
jgi:hypothetical protein